MKDIYCLKRLNLLQHLKWQVTGLDFDVNRAACLTTRITLNRAVNTMTTTTAKTASHTHTRLSNPFQSDRVRQKKPPHALNICNYINIVLLKNTYCFLRGELPPPSVTMIEVTTSDYCSYWLNVQCSVINSFLCFFLYDVQYCFPFPTSLILLFSLFYLI